MHSALLLVVVAAAVAVAVKLPTALPLKERQGFIVLAQYQCDKIGNYARLVCCCLVVLTSESLTSEL